MLGVDECVTRPTSRCGLVMAVTPLDPVAHVSGLSSAIAYCMPNNQLEYPLGTRQAAISEGQRTSGFWFYIDRFGRDSRAAAAMHEQECASLASVETADLNGAIARASGDRARARVPTRLMADVVTGKLDVREAATALPDDRIAEPWTSSTE